MAELAMRLAELAAIDTDVVGQRGGEALVTAYLADATEALRAAGAAIAGVGATEGGPGIELSVQAWAEVARHIAQAAEVADSAQYLARHLKKIRRRIV